MIHEKVIRLIKTIKGKGKSEKILAYLYTHGNCYQFYLILKEFFPSAEAYAVDFDRTNINKFILSHIVTKIDGKFYDINGEFILNNTSYTKIKKLDENEIKIAEQFEYGKVV